MPLKPNLVEQTIFLKAHLGPGPLLDLLGGMAFKAVATAVELGLFEALADRPATAAELAERIGADERGVRFLADALEPLGYLERVGEGYGCSAMTRKWLLSTSETSLAELFPFFDDSIARWSYLADSVREGGPARDVGEWLTGHRDGWERYHRGMRAISGLLTDEIVGRVEVPRRARRLLDLGGSHGLHAVRFCERYPALEATVLDRGPARAVAEQTIEAAGLGGRVSFREGDFVDDDLGEGWDVVLLFNVVRAFPEVALRRIFDKVAAATSPGGIVVVMDQLVERLPSPMLRANARLVELELLNSSPGDVHREGQVRAWLEAAGFSGARLVPLRRSGGQALVVADRPSP